MNRTKELKQLVQNSTGSFIIETRSDQEVRSIRATLWLVSKQLGIPVKTRRVGPDLHVFTHDTLSAEPAVKSNKPAPFVITVRDGRPSEEHVLKMLGPEVITEKLANGQLNKNYNLAYTLNRDDSKYLTNEPAQEDSPNGN